MEGKRRGGEAEDRLSLLGATARKFLELADLVPFLKELQCIYPKVSPSSCTSLNTPFPSLATNPQSPSIHSFKNI